MCILNGKKQKARPKEVKLEEGGFAKGTISQARFFFSKTALLLLFIFPGREEGGGGIGTTNLQLG